MKTTDLFHIEHSATNLIDYLFSATTDINIAMDIIQVIGDTEQYYRLKELTEKIDDIYFHFLDEFADEYEG
ncbi:hypothetical protein ACF3NG_10115 [Aerococcaceae bacterium WGS1372]